MKTVSEALAAGWRITDRRLTRGYVSRRNFAACDAPVYAGQGSRKGYLYYEAPNWDSSRYSYRVYLIYVAS